MLNIYIANLGKYNEGKLVGKWVELPCYNLKEVLKQIGVIEGTTYEEYAIHDYESDIEGVEISEYADIYELNELAEQLDALTAHEKEHLSAYIEAHCANLAYALEHFEKLKVSHQTSYILWMLVICNSPSVMLLMLTSIILR